MDGELPELPRVVGGRYGLSSKEFTPGMVAGDLRRARPRAAAAPVHRRITDDVGDSSIGYDPTLDITPEATTSAVFFGLGSDGTVGANKNTDQDPRCGRDHVRAGILRLRLEEVGLPDGVPPSLRTAADPGALPGAAGAVRRLSPLRACSTGWTCSAGPRPEPPCCWTARCRRSRCGTRWRVRSRTRSSRSRSASTPSTPAVSPGRPVWTGRTNTVLQTCFFAISGVLPRDRAIERIKEAIRKTYGRRGPRWSSATRPRWTRRSRPCTGSRCRRWRAPTACFRCRCRPRRRSSSAR